MKELFVFGGGLYENIKRLLNFFVEFIDIDVYFLLFLFYFRILKLNLCVDMVF